MIIVFSTDEIDWWIWNKCKILFQIHEIANIWIYAKYLKFQ